MSDPKYLHITDAELLERFEADGDNQWLGILLHRYTLLLFGVSMKYLKNEEEARDAVQQVCLKVITELPKYKVTYFKSWLFMIARNHCLMKLRKSPANRIQSIDDAHPVVSEEQWQRLDKQDQEKLYTWLTESMQELNPEQSTCIQLFFLQKKSYQEIADQTQFNLLQVKSHIQNGKRNLRILMEKKMKAQNFDRNFNLS